MKSIYWSTIRRGNAGVWRGIEEPFVMSDNMVVDKPHASKKMLISAAYRIEIGGVCIVILDTGCDVSRRQNVVRALEWRHGAVGRR